MGPAIEAGMIGLNAIVRVAYLDVLPASGVCQHFELIRAEIAVCEDCRAYPTGKHTDSETPRKHAMRVYHWLRTAQLYHVAGENTSPSDSSDHCCWIGVG